MNLFGREVVQELSRRRGASLTAVGAFAGGASISIVPIAGTALSGTGSTTLAIKYGTEAWRAIRAIRPLGKMGHAARHYKDFLKYANLTKEEVAKILEYVRQTGTQTGTGSSGERILEKIVEIGSHQVTVKVLESTGGVIKTGYPVP
jgi:hypothetical protein